MNKLNELRKRRPDQKAKAWRFGPFPEFVPKERLPANQLAHFVNAGEPPPEPHRTPRRPRTTAQGSLIESSLGATCICDQQGPLTARFAGGQGETGKVSQKNRHSAVQPRIEGKPERLQQHLIRPCKVLYVLTLDTDAPGNVVRVVIIPGVFSIEF